MVSVASWMKKELNYMKDIFPEIIKGFLLFILCFSGVGAAILLRILEFNGNIIILGGVIVEIIAMLFCYIVFREYLEQEPSFESDKKKKGKK